MRKVFELWKIRAVNYAKLHPWRVAAVGAAVVIVSLLAVAGTDVTSFVAE